MTYRYRVRMIHEQCNGWASPSHVFAGLLPLLHQLLVKLDEQKRLILHGGKEIVVADKVENIGSAQAKEEWQRFTRLTVGHVANLNV